MNKRLQELNDAVFSKDDIVFVNKTSRNVIFVDADLVYTVFINYITLGKDNFNEEDPESIIQVTPITCCNR